MFNIYGNPHTFRKRYITKEVHSFSGYTEIHWSDGHVDKHIPGIRHSDLKLGEQKMDPGTPWYGYFYNPETNKHEGQWVVSDDLHHLTALTEEEHGTYVATGYGNYHTHRMKPGVPFFTLLNNTETGLREGTWAVSDESGNITFLTDEEKINYVKSYNDGKFKGELPIDKSEQEERD